MRRSAVTGTHRIRHWMHGQVTLLLHDGAEAVPVREVDPIVSFLSADGDRRCTFVYCGPVATLPQAYAEHVEHDEPTPGMDTYVFTLGEAQLRRAVLRDMAPDELEVWRILRHDFVILVEQGYAS